MSISVQELATKLGGAIGCDYNTTRNQLVFVEFDTGKLSALNLIPGSPPTATYKVLGTGYNQPEDVKLSTDGVHAYVTERTGDLVKVALSSANRGAATVVTTGMTAPQQLFLDEAHNAAYVVEFASPGSLLKINLTSKTKTVVVTGLDHPIGVVLDSSLQYAYVSEQTTGPDKGRISKIQLSSAVRTTIAKGLINPFFLTWADAAQDSLLVPQRDPANSIVNVNVKTGVTNVVASGVPFRPSSVALPTAGVFLICSDSVIEEINFMAVSNSDPLLIGIGLIPFDKVNSVTGLATTPANSPFPVTNAPFGGKLPIIVNHALAYGDGARYYQVLVDTIPHVDSWTNYPWNGTDFVLQPINAQTIGPSVGCYPVNSPGQLWEIANLGDLLDSTSLSNGLHTLVLQFLDSGGNKMKPDVKSLPLKIMVNNQSCVAAFSPPVLTTPPAVADGCGLLHYGANKTNTVSLAFTASQPANFATFSFALVRGLTPLTALSTSGPVSPPPPPITGTVNALLGATCTNGAAFAADLYVAASMTNGWWRQSQYDAQALMGFTLVP